MVAAAMSGVSPHLAAHAQGGLGPRIDAVRDGVVRMSFAARDGVCGTGGGWSRTRPSGKSVSNNNWTNSRDVVYACDAGPVRLVVVREHGETTDLRTSVGGVWRADTGVTDLGTVSSREAGWWLLAVAETAPDKPARAAMTALTITDSVDAWPALLRIAQNGARPREVRSQATYLLGEVAGEKVTASLDSIAYDVGDREVRKQAIFAMSRRDPQEAATNLMRMAETLPDRELRQTAVFWLSRVDDPRVLVWIKKMLDATK